ncbi:hypothetical protein CI610_03482 [invertebrate metagenome]|uniref:Uncharacterized protein n=1 Tax=invertebrate metagenome TaxID=1711999 RepID=A0A2H9T317_9ZZZZ
MSGETGKIGGNSHRPVYNEQPDIPADTTVRSGSKRVSKAPPEKQIKEGLSKTPKTTLQERSVASHETELSIKNRARQLNDIVQKLRVFSTHTEGYHYKSAQAALNTLLKQVSESHELSVFGDKKLPDEINQLIACRYVELKSVDIADQLMSDFSSDPMELYSEIGLLLEMPFSSSSSLQIVVKHSPLTSMGCFSDIGESMNSLFMEKIYSVLSERMNNLSLPEAMQNSNNVKQSYNERANDLAILKSR